MKLKEKNLNQNTTRIFPPLPSEVWYDSKSASVPLVVTMEEYDDKEKNTERVM